MITGNKGEWSELYVLFKLLGEKELHSGDGNLNRLDTFFPVIRIIRDELQRRMRYSIEEGGKLVVVTEDGNEVARLGTDEFLRKASELFSHIQAGGNTAGAFAISEIEPFLRKIHCQKIKAKSQDKADIHIVIHDYHTGTQPDFGFSIKSKAGSASTLLNASKATTVRYWLDGEMDEAKAEAINSISGNGKMLRLVQAIAESGCALRFDCTLNPTFDGNLRMVDSNMPEIVGWMLADCYRNKDMDIWHAIERISEANPQQYCLEGGHRMYEYKMKGLMVAVALGMLPATTWQGRYEATGGYLVVKGDGDVVCFHIYDRNMLEDYLARNTKFETPDVKRYDMGRVYHEDGRYYLNLVVQIRFK
ncbi:MAG: HpaII family restriction endonuclease [Prevotellaceae bacterium]|nr:HpaII family restriction endonuclease [Prevotellaceae bacterium]